MTRIIGALLGLLLPTSAEAVQLHFEAWPTPSGTTCPAPCYEMRMFLQIDPWETQQSITSIQMDIRIEDGALAAEIPVFPARNDNAGNGNVHARSAGTSSVGVPWDLSSTVAHSPAEGFDALAVHGAFPFTIDTFADLIDAPGTSCFDANRCSFVREALALNRIYFGFINITRSATPPVFDPSFRHSGPVFAYGHRPNDVPYFVVEVGNVLVGGAPFEVLLQSSSDHGFITFMPEPSPALLFAVALVMMLALRLRRRGRPEPSAATPTCAREPPRGYGIAQAQDWRPQPTPSARHHLPRWCSSRTSGEGVAVGNG